MWAPLLRETARIQMFHGVGGKYGFDAPDRSMREWHRLFFVNERRLRNFIARGAIDADSPAIRLVGMPKVDCLVDGTFQRDHVLRALGLDPAAADRALRADLVAGLVAERDRRRAARGARADAGQRDREAARSLARPARALFGRRRLGGAAAAAARAGQGALAPGHDISPYLVAADLMITDHSSAGFEFLLRDRPLVRIHRPELIELANIHPDYVALLASVSRSVDDLPADARPPSSGRWPIPPTRAPTAGASPPTSSIGRAARRRAPCMSSTT